jgi:biopolymer transport protein ExbB
MKFNRAWFLNMLAIAGVACAVVPMTSIAQDTAAPATAVGMTSGMSFDQIMRTGGGVMWVLAGASFLTVVFVVYFAMVIRVAYVVPRRVQRDIIDKLKSGAPLDDVHKFCEDNPCALSMVVARAIDYMRNSPGTDVASLKDIMEGEGARQSDSIQGQAQYLLDIAVLSPMLGLLGTVIGMLQAFNAVALDTAVARPVELAAGVSKALVATAFGLIVGIPSMGFYGYFRRKASNVVSNLELAAIEVFTVLAGRRKK